MAVVTNTNLNTKTGIRGQALAPLTGKVPTEVAIDKDTLLGTDNNQAWGPELSEIGSRILDVVRGANLFAKFMGTTEGAEPYTIPANSGSMKVQWFRYLDIPYTQQGYAIAGKQDTSETGYGEGFAEGTPGQPVNRQRERVTVVTKQRGHYVISTDRSLRESLHNLWSKQTQALMTDFMQVMDIEAQQALVKVFVDTGDLNNVNTQRADATGIVRTNATKANNVTGGIVSVDTENATAANRFNTTNSSIREGNGTNFGYRQAVQKLQDNNAKRFLPALYATDKVSTQGMQASYVALCNTYTKHQLENDSTNNPNFIRKEKYADAREALEEEFGSTYDLRWFASTQVKYFEVDNNKATPTKEKVYPVFILAQNAFTRVTVANQGFELMVKPVGQPDSGDPLGQKGTVGWKAQFVHTVLNPLYYFMLYHA